MKVAILMGSINDLKVVQEASDIIKKFSVDVQMFVMSAHRTPAKVLEFSANAYDNGYRVIIAAAGKAAHLAGVVASQTVLPVIGLPILSSTLDGLDSLLSTVQMPSGIPVATVAINGGTNAGLLALQILATSDKVLSKKLQEHRVEMAKKIEDDNGKLSN